MKFKEKIQEYLRNKNIVVGTIEQDGEVESIICHILKSENEKVNLIKDEMEKELDVAIMLSDMFGMNVIIIESNNLGE